MEILSDKGKINEIVISHKGKDMRFLTNVSQFDTFTGSVECPCRVTFVIEDTKEIDNLISVFEHVSKVLEDRYYQERFKPEENWRQ